MLDEERRRFSADDVELGEIVHIRMSSAPPPEPPPGTPTPSPAPKPPPKDDEPIG